MRLLLLGLFTTVWLVAALHPAGRQDTPARWWKGNTHTHTLWSDGDGAPQLVTRWYVDHGYDFLVLSDHNVMLEGERWVPVTEKGPLTEERLQELIGAFGEDDVGVREVDGRAEMRLETLAELRARFERPGDFLLIPGEEITDSFERRPVHVNGLNLGERIEPAGGETLVDTMNRNIARVLEHGKKTGRPVLAHLNHPNFGWAFTARDLARIEGERFFEVHNGHTGVNNYGDETHTSVEEMWDIALTERLAKLDAGLLYGLATDDAHDYHETGARRNNPGRAWVMVRARELTPEALLGAMHAGDFYATTGVLLSDVAADDERMIVDVDAEEGVVYATLFLGTRVDEDGAVLETGALLKTTTEDPAVYEFQGDELYVRARVVSTEYHENPYHVNDKEAAWTQPVVPR